MRLIDDPERAVAKEESLFRAQLLREDLARLRKLEALAQTLGKDEFAQQGMRIGWTQGDARTGELQEPLAALLDAVYRLIKEREKRDELEERVSECWHALHRVRMERLLGCLSTPLPRPAD
jgi:hypothetical protein